MLRERGVETPMEIIPTGVDVARDSRPAMGNAFGKTSIPGDALVAGYVGRLAQEKNLEFLAKSVARFLAAHPEACFLVVGAGPCEDDIRRAAASEGVADRLHLTGFCQGMS